MDVKKANGSSMKHSSKRRAAEELRVPDSDSDGHAWEQVPQEVDVPKIISKEVWGKIFSQRRHKDCHSR